MTKDLIKVTMYKQVGESIPILRLSKVARVSKDKKKKTQEMDWSR